MYNNGLGRDETLTPSLSRITASLLTARVQIGFNTFHRSFVFFFSPKALEQFLESLNNFSSPKANTQTKIAGPSSETIIFCFTNWYFYHSYLQNHWILFCECKKQSVVFRPFKGTHDCSQAIGKAPFIPFFFRPEYILLFLIFFNSLPPSKPALSWRNGSLAQDSLLGKKGK